MSTVEEIKRQKKDIEKLYEELPIKDRDEIKINFQDICKVIDANNSNIEIIYEDLEKQIIYEKLKNTKRTLLKYIKEKY